MSTDYSTPTPQLAGAVGFDVEVSVAEATEPSLEEAWRAVCATLERKVSAHSFRNYVMSATLLPSDDADVLRLGYVNEIAHTTALSVYRADFEEELLRVLNRHVTVRVELLPRPEGMKVETVPPRLVPVEEAVAHVPKVPVEPRGEGEPPLSKRLSNGLDTRYSFDAFVVGSSNQFAHAACKAVADNPGTTYNPLFLWGGPGLGKTHLAQAVGLQVLSENPSRKVLYTTSEQFTNELIHGIRNRSSAEFRKRYREVDVLVIDDIQFLAGKPATEEEFFHTFNDLHARGKQLIITSDTAPGALDKMQERLRSRFQWGLTADVQPPEMETRIAILKAKAQAMNMELDDEVAQFLGVHMRQNIRQLEGCLLQLSAYSKAFSTRTTIENAKLLLRSNLIRGGDQLDCDQIMKACADSFRVTLADVKGPSREKQIARARQAAMYLSRQLIKLSFPEIGRRFGRDHSTVMTAVKRVPDLMAKDADFRRLVEILEQELNPNY